MNYGSIVPSFYFYKFADAISKPYTSFEAYRAGVIDERGNFIKPESSTDPFEYFVIKLKKIFDQLPPGLTKYELSNYAASLNLFSEEAEKFNVPKHQFIALVEGLLAINCGPEASYIELLEDMSAGGMATAGGSPGYNTGEISGFDPPMGRPMRRKPVTDSMFHMFDVSSEDFGKITNNQMNEIDYLRRFGIRNPESTIMVRNSKDGNLYMIPKKKKLKEQFNLNFLSEQNESGAVEEYNDVNDKQNKPQQATLTDDQEESRSSKSAGAYAVGAVIRHLETLGGSDETEAVLHPKTKKPLRSYTRVPYFVEHPETKEKIVNTEELQPGQFRVGPGSRDTLDLQIRDWDSDDGAVKGYHGSIEIKSMTDKPRFNIDVSETSAPKSKASYTAVAVGMGLDPEKMREWPTMDRADVFREIRRMGSPEVESQVKDVPVKNIDTVRTKPLAKIVGERLAGPKPGDGEKNQKGFAKWKSKAGRIGRRITRAIKSAFAARVANEKGGLLFGVNADSPEPHLHAITMSHPKDEADKKSLEQFLDNLGGLQITAHFGGPELSRDPKVTKNKRGRMIRIDTKEVRGKEVAEQLRTKKRSNAEIAFGRHKKYYDAVKRNSLSDEEIEKIMGG